MKNLLVGMVVTLKVPCLGNQAGVKGVVYETYDLGGRPGCSVIFRNGLHDGFSPEEQERNPRPRSAKLRCVERCEG